MFKLNTITTYTDLLHAFADPEMIMLNDEELTTLRREGCFDAHVGSYSTDELDAYASQLEDYEDYSDDYDYCRDHFEAVSGRDDFVDPRERFETPRWRKLTLCREVPYTRLYVMG